MKHLFFLFISFFITLQTSDSVEYCDDLIAKGIDALYNKEHSKSLELLTEAKTIALKNDWYDQQFKAINCIGLNYYQMLDYGEALDHYLEAYKIAIKELSPSREMTIQNNIALVYMQEGKFNESEKYQKRAYDLAVTAHDSLKTAMYAGNLAAIYNETNALEKATNYIDLAKRISPNDNRVFMQIAIAEAENLLARKNYNGTENVLKPLIEKVQIPEFNDHKVAVFLMYSKIYEHQEKLNDAIEITKRAQDENLTYNNNISIFNRLSDIYFAKKDYEISLKYKDSVIKTKDSLNAMKDRTLYQNSKIKLELQDFQKVLLASQNQLIQEKRTKYYIIGFSILIVILLLWLLRSNLVKYRQKKTLAERSQKITELELNNKQNANLLLEKQIKQKETVSLLEKEKLKNEIESKNRTLTAKALQLANRNEKIYEFIDAIETEQDLKKHSFLKSKINQLKGFIKKDNDWEEFLIHFEELNSHFLTTIKERHPSLNSNDIRFICYVYMNLTTKEISSLFNITLEATRKRKERIAKKMELTDSDNLYDYISTI
ncbi:MAG: tetratricopeptide repeat protein [Aquaticitalea sp.]